jgi:hypothetical protein
MKYYHRRLALLLTAVCCAYTDFRLVLAHDIDGHTSPTYEVTPHSEYGPEDNVLSLEIIDESTGRPTPARFSLEIDSASYVPANLGQHGIRFVAIHERKQQRFVATYSRGTGRVEIPLPKNSRSGVLFVTKGFTYLPAEVPFSVEKNRAEARVVLERWTTPEMDSWLSAETHMHFDRLDPENDRDWLTLLEGDGLSHGHFLVLKGANFDGIWSRQYAYGKKGEATDGKTLLRPGEEYRDGSQGHINLLGINEVIQPISTGGIGQPKIPYNYPPLLDVLRKTKELGGLGGPAHGTSLGKRPTGLLDTILGAVDFFEIANTHLYHLDEWYHLMNCGYLIPPTGGTDLPNFPHRDPWQPLFGETRTYLRLGSSIDFQSWKQVLISGQVFVSSGPIIDLTVDGVEPGGTLKLPEGGRVVLIEATLSSPRPLSKLEIIHHGSVIALDPEASTMGRIHILKIRQKKRISQSCWLAARGVGVEKDALKKYSQIDQNTVAHTSAIRVQVGSRPIWSDQSAKWILNELRSQKGYYEERGQFQEVSHRERFLSLFDEAISELRSRQTTSTE